jgi:hypothetical protein
MESIWIRESHLVTCGRCGWAWDQWDTGVSLEDAISRIRTSNSALADLQVRSCPRCGHLIEWEVAIGPGSDRGALPLRSQRRLAATLHRLVREDAGRDQIAKLVRAKYGVVGFYVEQ